ncbi:MAG: 16S rRNA (cytidine(1402)-2'-O)-methyltransferase [Bacteroidaceae bacterium]|nr:16S rRNA (cytidine(1402)-2'-O)-methyltransferase [Bacteroidaceae bacterium]
MGTLYVVPTPVGNLEDITARALRVLRQADLILAEDTRTSGNLLRHFDIRNAMQSFHKFNEHQTVARFVARLQGGETIALVSDAGTPGISDPGYLLVHEAVRAGAEVVTLPGATAFVPALVSSGLPCDRFCFEGFLPQKKGRLTRLQELSREPRTIVFYESPHRVVHLLEQLAETFGADRPVSVSREISKVHEESVRGTVAEVLVHFQADEPRGEFVVVVGGYSGESDSSDLSESSELSEPSEKKKLSKYQRKQLRKGNITKKSRVRRMWRLFP